MVSVHSDPELPLTKRHSIEEDFEVLAATMILDRNSQVRYHKCMVAAGVRKTSRARRSAQTVDPITC